MQHIFTIFLYFSGDGPLTVAVQEDGVEAKMTEWNGTRVEEWSAHNAQKVFYSFVCDQVNGVKIFHLKRKRLKFRIGNLFQYENAYAKNEHECWTEKHFDSSHCVRADVEILNYFWIWETIRHTSKSAIPFDFVEFN